MLMRLLIVDPGVFRRIALFTVFESDFPNLLRDFLSLSLVCHASHRTLAEDSESLYYDIFSVAFDTLGPLQKLGLAVIKEHAMDELKRRFTALKVLRRGNLDDPDLTGAFWTTYMMFDDSDKDRKNVKHILATGLHGFLKKFLRQRLYRNSESNRGWPIPNEQNSLAVALLWLSSSRHTLDQETKEQQDEITRLLQPLVFAAFRYPIFSIPEFCFDITAYKHQSTFSNVHGTYPPPPLSLRNLIYFGRLSRLWVPSISIFATLSFFVRQEINTHEIPRHLRFENRQDTLGTQKGPTIDDIRHFYEHCRTHFVDFFQTDVGMTYKSTPCVCPASVELPVYRLGTLTGKWQGSFIIPFLESYKSWLTTLAAPQDFAVPGRSPLYMTLQEHYICDPNAMVPSGHFSEGATNAWLPEGLKWVQRENVIEMSDDKGSFRSFYHTFQRGNLPPSERIVDVIITGKTDWKHTAAWGDYEILGRIRLEDGLILLARRPLTEDIGTTLLRGHVISSQNFVGRFKGISSGTQPAPWEAVFSLCQAAEVGLNTL